MCIEHHKRRKTGFSLEIVSRRNSNTLFFHKSKHTDRIFLDATFSLGGGHCKLSVSLREREREGGGGLFS
jgi:hypothetical protein